MACSYSSAPATYLFDPEFDDGLKYGFRCMNRSSHSISLHCRHLIAESDLVLCSICSRSLSCRHVAWMLGGNGMRRKGKTHICFFPTPFLPLVSLLLLTHPFGGNLFLSPIFLCLKNSRWRLKLQRMTY